MTCSKISCEIAALHDDNVAQIQDTKCISRVAYLNTDIHQFKEFRICMFEPFAKTSSTIPTQSFQARHICKFTRRPVRFRSIKLKLAIKADHNTYLFCKVADRDLLSGVPTLIGISPE